MVMTPGLGPYDLNIADFHQIVDTGAFVIGAYSLFVLGDPAVKQAIYRNVAQAICLQPTPFPEFKIRDRSPDRTQMAPSMRDDSGLIL